MQPTSSHSEPAACSLQRHARKCRSRAKLQPASSLPTSHNARWRNSIWVLVRHGPSSLGMGVLDVPQSAAYD